MDREAEKALYTCRERLTATQLKDICRYRGFVPPKRDRESLAAFVAPRLAGLAGVAEAMASLDRDSLRMLHLVAGTKHPLSMHEARKAIANAFRLQTPWNDRENFSALVSRLGNRGLLLFSEGSFQRPGRVHYEDLTMEIPPGHRALLPPYPVACCPLGAVQPADIGRFWGDGLRVAAQGGAIADRHDAGAVKRFAARVGFVGGKLVLETTPDAGPSAWLDSLAAFWLNAQEARHYLSHRVALLVCHILDHLPEGCGCRADSIREEIAQFGLKAEPASLERFCSDGCEIGFLVSDGAGEQRVYALAPFGEGAVQEREPEYVPHPEGLRVDPASLSPGALLQLLSISLVSAEKQGDLLVRPDLHRIGRAGVAIEGEMPVVRALTAHSPVFGQAFERVRSLRGKTVVHDGVKVMRVEDPTFRALLAGKLGEGAFRPLGGGYFAVPGGKVAEVEAEAKKMGLVPRRER